MINQKEKTIGEIVAQNYKAAAVFKSYNIDFCCKGNRTIYEACAQRGIPEEALKKALEKAVQETDSGSPKFDSWASDLLADYIEKKHHRYVKRILPEINAYLDKVCKVHGNNHPELFEVQKLFRESARELANHMQKEEIILFPFVRKLAEADAGDKKNINRPPFGTVGNPIEMMMHEHDAEGERFRKIAQLTDGYTPPVDACNTYKVAFALLQEFEEDLHQHIHLENNILFPKAIALEEQMAA